MAWRTTIEDGRYSPIIVHDDHVISLDSPRATSLCDLGLFLVRKQDFFKCHWIDSIDTSRSFDVNIDGCEYQMVRVDYDELEVNSECMDIPAHIREKNKRRRDCEKRRAEKYGGRESMLHDISLAAMSGFDTAYMAALSVAAMHSNFDMYELAELADKWVNAEEDCNGYMYDDDYDADEDYDDGEK